MGKNIVIALLLLLCGFSTWIAWHNSKPICDDLVRVRNAYSYQYELVCEVNLGDIPVDKADVIIRTDK